MPASDVRVPSPLTRLAPWYPGQFGVPFTGADTGLRLSCEGTIFYVDPNHVDCSDLRDGTEPTGPLETVEEAISQCEAYKGDVILVMANNNYEYGDDDQGRTTPVNEAVTVDVPGISIIGVAPSPQGVYWEIDSGETAISVQQPDVLIEGFAFYGLNNNETAIHAEYSTVYGDAMTVRHCYFNEDLEIGINLDYSWYTEVWGCYFDGPDYGVFNAGTGDQADYLRIHHNVFYECGQGAIHLPQTRRSFIWQNQVYRQNKAVNSFINLNGGSNNLVSQNVLACTLALYPTTCKDGANDSWCQNYCDNGVTTGAP